MKHEPNKHVWGFKLKSAAKCQRERGGPYCWQLILLIIHPMTAHYIIIWITSPFSSGPHLSQASLLQKREQLKVLRLEVRRGQLSRGALGRGRDSEIEIFCGGLVDWLVVYVFFCFLMLCNVFHPTSDDYLNSLIDTHSHVYTYTYIYIYHFMYTYQYKQYIDLNIYIYTHILYCVSARVSHPIQKRSSKIGALCAIRSPRPAIQGLKHVMGGDSLLRDRLRGVFW